MARRDFLEVNPPSARALFARSVRRIEIEIGSYCNRVCSYCPNSFVDRRGTAKYMDDALFDSIINQLAEINYNGKLNFHRYNEPLSDRAYAIARISQARATLPRAVLTIFTNGDYLTRDYLHELYVSGCRHICATLHTEPEEYADASAAEMLEKRLAKLGYPYDMKTVPTGIQADVHVAGDLCFTYQVHDFGRVVNGDPVAKDRGQALAPSVAARRTAACIIPFTEMQIEMDGTLVPCCHIRTDVPAHAGYALGKLTPGSDLFETWTNQAYVAWRKSLAEEGPKDPPCATCTHGIEHAPPAGGRVGELVRSPGAALQKLKQHAAEHGVLETARKILGRAA